jgi:DNA polymerase I-like protein with 3'-5' exonuclease and polymerase domains
LSTHLKNKENILSKLALSSKMDRKVLENRKILMLMSAYTNGLNRQVTKKFHQGVVDKSKS